MKSPFGLVVQRLTRILLRNEKILGSIPRMGTFFCQCNPSAFAVLVTVTLFVKDTFFLATVQ